MTKIKKYFSDWTPFEIILLITATITMITLSIIGKDTVTALICGICGVISVVLCAKGKLENYFFGLIQAIIYVYICYKAHIFGEVMYNVLMVPAIIFGFFNWKKNMNSEQKEVQARNLTLRGWIILILGSVAAIFAYSMLLKYLGGNYTLVDSITTVFSVIATILMLARYSEQWLMWLTVGTFSIVLWSMALVKGDNGAITMLVMRAAYFINAVYGYINWRKMAKKIAD